MNLIYDRNTASFLDRRQQRGKYSFTFSHNVFIWIGCPLDRRQHNGSPTELRRRFLPRIFWCNFLQFTYQILVAERFAQKRMFSKLRRQLIDAITRDNNEGYARNIERFCHLVALQTTKIYIENSHIKYASR